MPGTVIGTKLNHGYAGQVSRNGDEISRTFPVKAETKNIAFGMPVILNDDGSVQVMGEGATAEKFCGVAMRRVKTPYLYPNQNLGEYFPGQPCDVLERGSVTVECVAGDPKPAGDVYVYVSADKSGFAAAEDGANTVKLAGVRWASTKDANNVAELVILNRVGI